MKHRITGHGTGFTLIELSVGLALASVLVLGSLQLAAAITGSFRIQLNQASLQENARHAVQSVARHIREAGAHPQPWLLAEPQNAIADTTADAVSASSDRLVVRTWSARNCLGNPNPVTSASGQPRPFLREASFEINAAQNLAMHCRYGASEDALTVQLNNYGLIENAYAFQVLFAEDSDLDGRADRWVRAGDWAREASLSGVRVGLLLGTPEKVNAEAAGTFQVLDSQIEKRNTGRKYRVVESTIAIRSRT